MSNGRIEQLEKCVEELNGMRETALGEMHRKNGTPLASWFGCALPQEFADWKREYGFLRETVGLVDKNYRAYLKFSGPDRVRYLNAVLTNNIKDLQAGESVVSLFLSPQGHIQAEIETIAWPASLQCVSFAMIRERLREGLEKYIIMDDVTVTDETESWATVAVEGPKSAEVLERIGVPAASLKSRQWTEFAKGTSLVRRDIAGAEGFEFTTGREQVAAVWKTLAEAAASAGGGPAGYRALNSVRLEQGIPWFGYDFGEKQIPHEAGLENSHISYTKGCYTGQEIVERVRSRGQVNRVRVSLQFDGEAPEANTALASEGREVGYVTRAGFSPARSANIGMGYVRREKSGEGTRLDAAKTGARVIAPPIG
jgi:folate-binding protein YgfZ